MQSHDPTSTRDTSVYDDVSTIRIIDQETFTQVMFERLQEGWQHLSSGREDGVWWAIFTKKV